MYPVLVNLSTKNIILGIQKLNLMKKMIFGNQLKKALQLKKYPICLVTPKNLKYFVSEYLFGYDSIIYMSICGLWLR